MKLTEDMFRRYDESPDEHFYASPRLVLHIDEAAIAAVTQIYREYFAPGGAIIDLMSSWVSHLPPEIEYSHVVGLGLNYEELDSNPHLHQRIVQNLNAEPMLGFPSATFDGAGICVAIPYLTQPVDVLCEVRRILKPNAPVVITFSNRCFPTKAISAWQMLDNTGHLHLVAEYLKQAGFTEIEFLNRSPLHTKHGDPLFAVIARAPSETSRTKPET
jgi:SAM-dependent methyltransferase